jgi:hypothetical protein
VFNPGKEIGAMKRLTLHRIASFITSVAQLCEQPIPSIG